MAIIRQPFDDTMIWGHHMAIIMKHGSDKANDAFRISIAAVLAEAGPHSKIRPVIFQPRDAAIRHRQYLRHSLRRGLEQRIQRVVADVQFCQRGEGMLHRVRLRHRGRWVAEKHYFPFTF